MENATKEGTSYSVYDEGNRTKSLIPILMDLNQLQVTSYELQVLSDGQRSYL